MCYIYIFENFIVKSFLLLLTDISLQDKVVVYDNEKGQIGWASGNCNQIPHS